MTPIILPNYELNKDTITLIPAYHTDYDTIVWERDQQLFVKKPLLQLIREGCMEGGSEYDGRRAAVIHKTGVHSKVPIPINPREQIYAFPTHSPKLHECVWIFYHHIKSFKPNPKQANQSIITFLTGKDLILDISFTILERQIHRTSYCIVRFSH